MKHFKYRALARRYAIAVFDLAREGGRVDEVQAELARFGAALNQVPLLTRAIEEKEIALDSRLGAVDKVAASLSLSPLVTTFIRLLVEKGRMELFDGILSFYQAMTEVFEKMARAEVGVADKSLARQFKEKIEKVLSDILKKNVSCETRIDESLVGGAVIKVGDVLIDASIAGRLEKMRQELL